MVKALDPLRCGSKFIEILKLKMGTGLIKWKANFWQDLVVQLIKTLPPSPKLFQLDPSIAFSFPEVLVEGLHPSGLAS